MKFILDNNFVLDVVTRRKSASAQYVKLMYALISNGQAAMSSSQIHNLRYLVKKQYPQYEQDYLKVESRLQIVKTPAYIDRENLKPKGIPTISWSETTLLKPTRKVF